jgi:hypothetical protein
MTQVSERTGVEHDVELAFTYGLTNELGFHELTTTLNDLRSLVVLSRLMLMQDAESGEPISEQQVGNAVEQSSVEAELFTRIDRVSYNSPLEITLLIMGGAGSAIAIANRVISLHNRYQQARVFRSEADVRVAVNQAILAELEDRERPIIAESEAAKSVIHHAGEALQGIANVELGLGD